MAVIREYTITGDRLSAGAAVMVLDDDYRDAGAEEIERRRREAARVIRRIDFNAQLRRMAGAATGREGGGRG